MNDPNQIAFAQKMAAPLMGALVVCMLSWNLFREKQWQLIGFDDLMRYLRAALLSTAIYGLLNIFFRVTGVSTLPMAATFVAFVFLVTQVTLTGLHVQPLARGLILLAFSFAASVFAAPGEIFLVDFAGMLGLAAGKMLAIGLEKIPSEAIGCEDIILPGLWLSRHLGCFSTADGDVPASDYSFLLCTIGIVLLVRWVQPPFLKVDHLYVKRIALALTGAAVMYATTSKGFHAPHLGIMCAIFGASLFGAYLLEAIDDTSQFHNEVQRALRRTAVIVGINIIFLYGNQSSFTVPAGLLGASSMLVAETSYSAAILSLFWICQSQLLEYSRHLTFPGANPYTLSMLSLVPILTDGALVTMFSLITANRGRFTYTFTSAFLLLYCVTTVLNVASLVDLGAVFMLPLLPLALTISIWHTVFLEKRARPQAQCMILVTILLTLMNLGSLNN